MTHIGVREFRDHATRYLADEDVVAIERHGKVIGFYVPVRTAEEEERTLALGQLRQAVARVMKDSGLDEGQLAAALDVKQRG